MKPFIPVLIAADCLAPDAPTTRVGHGSYR